MTIFTEKYIAELRELAANADMSVFTLARLFNGHPMRMQNAAYASAAANVLPRAA